MAKKPTLTTVASGFNSNVVINENFQALADALDNTLSLDGSVPNALQADLDINGNDILNAGNINTLHLKVGGYNITEAAFTPDWMGSWSTATDYVVNDLVFINGSSYICIQVHTSGVFATDLANSYWELFASQGAAGPGTGDMLSSNNLSDLTDTVAARTNLGVAVGIDVQEHSPVLDDLAGLTQETNKIPYFNTDTTASTLSFVDEDDMVSDSATALPSQQSVKAYVDSNIVTTSDWELWETFYDYSVDGSRTTKESSALQDGYEYKFQAQGLLCGGAASYVGLQVYKETAAAYHTQVLKLSPTTAALGDDMWVEMDLPMPRTSTSFRAFRYITHEDANIVAGTDDYANRAQQDNYLLTFAAADKIGKVKLVSGPSTSFTGGKAVLFRRKIT